MFKRSYSSFVVIKWLLGQVKPYWLTIIFVTLLFLCKPLCFIGLTEGLRRLVKAAEIQNELFVWRTFYFMISVNVIWFAVGLFRIYLQAILNNNATYQLQASFYKHIINLNHKDLQYYHTSNLITRLEKLTYFSQNGINHQILDLFESGFTIPILFCYLFNLHADLTLLLIVIAFLTPLLFTQLNFKLRKNFDDLKQKKVEINALATDLLQGSEIVRAFNLQKQLLQKIDLFYNKAYRLKVKNWHLSFAFWQIEKTIIYSGYIVILGYGGFQVIKGSLTIATIVAFLFSLEKLISPIFHMVNIWPELQEALYNTHKIREIMLLPKENREEIVITPYKEESGIVFDKVSFAYKDNKEVLSEASFTANVGAKTIFLGPSDSGKSTILKLLIRLYPVDSGQIRFNGNDIRSITLDQWREKIAYVAQTPSFFSISIAENLRQSKVAATEDEIWTALEETKLVQVIKKLPYGLETILGEKGVGLSFGEKQRLSIARAIIKNPEILLLDEVTSSLDNENTNFVRDSMEKLMDGRTTIILSRKLSTIKKANKIVYLEHGRIVEEGAYHELMALGGRFYNMFIKEFGSNTLRVTTDVSI